MNTTIRNSLRAFIWVVKLFRWTVQYLEVFLVLSNLSNGSERELIETVIIVRAQLWLIIVITGLTHGFVEQGESWQSFLCSKQQLTKSYDMKGLAFLWMALDCLITTWKMSGQFPFYYNYEFSKKALVIAHLVAAEHHTGIAEVMEFASHWSFRIFSGLYLYNNCLLSYLITVRITLTCIMNFVVLFSMSRKQFAWKCLWLKMRSS